MCKDKSAKDKVCDANNELDWEKREGVYANNRETLQEQFRFLKSLIVYQIQITLTCRSSRKTAQTVCRGFFTNPIHSATHFTWLTGIENLVTEVESNLCKQTGKLINLYRYHIFSTKLLQTIC